MPGACPRPGITGRNLPVVHRALQHVISPWVYMCLGWESCRPAGTGDDYSHFLPWLTPRSRFHFLNPHPSIFLVVFFGGKGSFAEGWCLLQGALSCSGRPTWVPAGCPCTEPLCAFGCSGCCSRGDGDPTSAVPGTTVERIRVRVRFPALLAEGCGCMHLQTALPNLQTQPCQSTPCSESPFSSCIPYGTGVPGLGQLRGKVFLQQPTRWAELYLARRRILRLLMPHRGPAMPACLPPAGCAEPGWLLGLSMTSAFLLSVGRSPRGCRNPVNHEYFWSDSSRVRMRWFLTVPRRAQLPGCRRRCGPGGQSAS